VLTAVIVFLNATLDTLSVTQGHYVLNMLLGWVSGSVPEDVWADGLAHSLRSMPDHDPAVTTWQETLG